MAEAKPWRGTPGRRQHHVCLCGIVHDRKTQGARRRHPRPSSRCRHRCVDTPPAYRRPDQPLVLALSPDQRCLYAVHGDCDCATAFAIDRETGQARLLNRAAIGGNNGVRQAVDASGKYLIVANSASGTVAVLPIMPEPSQASRVRTGSSRQSAEPHDIVFAATGRVVLVRTRVSIAFSSFTSRCQQWPLDACRTQLDPIPSWGRPAPFGLSCHTADGLGFERTRQHDHDLPLGWGTRPPRTQPSDHHAADRFYGL